MTRNGKYTVTFGVLTGVVLAFTAVEVLIGGSIWQVGLCLLSLLVIVGLLIRSIRYMQEDRRRASALAYENAVKAWRERK